MKELTKQELNDIVGGTLSGSVLSALARGIELIYELGRSLGSGIRRMIGKKYC